MLPDLDSLALFVRAAEMANDASGRQTVLRVHGHTSAMTQFLPADVASFQAVHSGTRIVLEACADEGAVVPEAPATN